MWYPASNSYCELSGSISALLLNESCLSLVKVLWNFTAFECGFSFGVVFVCLSVLGFLVLWVFFCVCVCDIVTPGTGHPTGDGSTPLRF